MSKITKREMSAEEKYISGLKDIEKKNSFIVPEKYFENFSSRLKDKIIGQEKTSSVLQGIQITIRHRLAFAASFIGLLIIIYSGVKYLLADTDSSLFPASELTENYDYQLSDIDDYMLYELYSETSTNNLEHTISADEEKLSAMVEYLLYSDYDIELLVKEL